MCRTSRHSCPTFQPEENEIIPNAIENRLTGKQELKQKFNVVTLERKTAEKSRKGLHWQRFRFHDIKVETMFNKEACKSQGSTMEPPAKQQTCHLKAKDMNLALETFPEFFCQEFKLYQYSFARPQAQKLSTKDFSARKQSDQSECGGLVLWYMQEYGL